GDAGRDERPRARRQLDPLARGEIEPRVAVVGARRDDRVRAEPLDLELDQPAFLASASATRYAAKRRSSRRGSRARISTPSGVSCRSSIGAPSAYRSDSAAPSSY